MKIYVVKKSTGPLFFLISAKDNALLRIVEIQRDKHVFNIAQAKVNTECYRKTRLRDIYLEE
jgi:hypothetical protein